MQNGVARSNLNAIAHVEWYGLRAICKFNGILTSVRIEVPTIVFH